jgi:hypothetical protein
MVTREDTAPTGAPGRAPIINPAAPLEQVLELLARHTACLHDLTKIMAGQSDELDVEASLRDISAALEPMVGMIDSLAQTAVARSYGEVRHG